MIEYPKIETLFNRNPSKMKEIIEGDYRLREFEMLSEARCWLITEKIDGTNIRVTFDMAAPDVVAVRGRTNKASLPVGLESMLLGRLATAFWDAGFAVDTPVTLYGEAYGPKIQSGGWYREDMNFRIFDVKVGDWWLNWDNVVDVATKLNLSTVPVLARDISIVEALNSFVTMNSRVTLEEGGDTTRLHEGIVARTDPLLLMRNGDRLMWKMKVRDLPTNGGNQ